MTTQQQEQRPDFPQKNRNKRSSWQRWLIASIMLLLIIVGLIIWILTTRNAFTPILPIVIFTVLGVLIALFQWLFPVSTNATEHPSTHQHTRDAPQIIVHVPATQPLHEPTTLPEKSSYRGIVGIPPPTDPRTIQQREHVVREVYAKLVQPDITAIALTGIGGVGKSTLAALLYRFVEEQRQTQLSPFQAETLWFTIDPAVTFADLVGNLFETLGRPFLDLNNLAPQNQAVALFNALNTTTKPRLIIIDQFENLLDWDTGHALTDRPGVGEWLDIINGQKCNCRVLLTSRPRPVGTREYPTTYLQEYFVGGLDANEGIALLRSQGVQGTYLELQSAVSHCAGHALSLTLLATLMHDHRLDFAVLFGDAELWNGDIATNLLDQIFMQKLNDAQRKLLQAFSAYREPVPFEAALTIINSMSKEQVRPALRTLLTQHLLEAVGEGRYQLHAIIADYVRKNYDEESEQANVKALRAAHLAAAEYYLHRARITCPPREKRRKVADIHDLVEGIWQFFQAEQWQEGYDLIQQEGILVDLEQWGENAILLELCQLLVSTDAWHPEPLQFAQLNNCMGKACQVLGRVKQALDYYERALNACKLEEKSSEKGWALDSLGRLYNTQGNKEQAQEYLKQALQIFRELGNSLGEASVLNNFGWVYSDQGQMEQAKKSFEQALQILREIGNHRGESSTLDNLGRTYSISGQKMLAREYYEQALKLRKEIGDRNGEGVTLANLGRVYKDLGQREQAQEYYEEALQILREVGDRNGEGMALTDLGVVQAELGEKEQARVSLEQALRLRQEVGNRRGESRVLTDLGQLYFDLGQREQAEEYYEQALQILKEVKTPWREGKVLRKLGELNADLGRREQAWKNYRESLNRYKEVGDRWEEGQTLYCIGMLYFEQNNYDIALACFLLAQNMLTEVLSPNRDKAKSSIEALHVLVGDEEFSTLLAYVEPQTQQIIDRALDIG